MKIKKTNLARCLRSYRLLSETTMRELAKEIGITAPGVCRIEQGHSIDATTLLKVMNWMAEIR